MKFKPNSKVHIYRYQQNITRVFNFITMNFCKTILRNQITNIKIVLKLKYEELLMKSLNKIGFLNTEAFITSYGIDCNYLSQEPMEKQIEIIKKCESIITAKSEDHGLVITKLDLPLTLLL